MPEASKFYLTTPIYYVNARPHIGHAYSTIVTDVIARYQRAQGRETWFLTGTDEHGQKIERSAKLAQRSPQEFADEVSGEFRRLWDRMGLTYDDFIRTTEERHRKGVQKLFLVLQERGFIYKSSYSGQYCVSEEMYVDVPAGAPCPECGRITETISEENYFFKLSAFERKLLELYESDPDFIRPEARKNEVISFVRAGLKDLSISRTTFDWGIPVPGDEKHVIYVWLDALANYMTAIGYGSDAPEDQRRFEKFWPADLHLIGKEISRFHCVYWPAFLLAAGLPLPKRVVAHGWLLFEESKMSKSRGNIVRTETILDGFGSLKPDLAKREQDLFASDALRYFLLREIVFGHDGNFSLDAVVERYNADLANGYGNLVSRTLAMTARYFDGAVPQGQSEPRIEEAFAHTAKLFGERLQTLEFSRGLEALWSLVAIVDGYITVQAPWKLASSSAETAKTDLANILYTCLEALRVITALVYPILPYSAGQVWAQLGLGEIASADLKNLRWGQLAPGTRLGASSPIFPRAEKEIIQRMKELETPATPAPAAPATTQSQPAAAAPAPSAEPVAAAAKIGIEDFAKVELRVGQVKVAERVKGADRLLRLEVDIGTEVRQIVAGLAEAYAPEALIGRKVVIVANLQPRKLRGLESNGMIVAASLGEGKPVLAGFLEEIEIGARLK
ncbi:MAG TPA: methionine--tRNA ligase [Acidobacteriaceae bacterium]|jgi:methionyl-tRNA synthetase|nr:methionine--tRNA ligase [Acidobacteriaceae bacterium]